MGSPAGFVRFLVWWHHREALGYAHDSMPAEAAAERAKAEACEAGLTTEEIAKLRTHAARLFSQDLRDEQEPPPGIRDIPSFLEPPGGYVRPNWRERRRQGPAYR